MPDPKAELGALAAQLVSIPSENPPGEEAACAAFVHEWFREHDIDAELLESPDPDRPQVAARVGTGEPTIVLNGHTDVVPVEDSAEWTDDPYGGTIRNGRLYGRGSVDMKTGLAIAMLLARDVADELESGALDGSLVVHAAMGEETADPGTETLLKRGYDGDFGIVLEPTDFRVATSSKGLAVYRVDVSGEATHASQPDAGRNPAVGICETVEAVDAYDDRLRSRDRTLCGTPLASVTELEAGVGTNYGVIPDRGRTLIDRRIVPGERLETVDDEIDDLLADIESRTSIELDWKRIQHYAPASIPADDPIANRVRELSEEIADAPTAPWGIEAATDVRNFINDANIPAITWGPGSLDRAHTTDEYIDLSDAQRGREILERVVREFLSGKFEPRP